MRRTSLILAIGLSLSSAAPRLPAQVPADSTRTAQDSALRVFFDCQGFGSGCDFDYIRTEITFVNYVRDRQDADVHILITTLETGAGGAEYTTAFIGRRRFAGTADTLRYFAGPNDTRDEVRQGLVRVLKLGLMRFVAATPLAKRIDISYTAPAQTASTTVRDPWNYWVFNINGGLDLSGQKSVSSTSINGSFSASRTTPAWKFNFGLSENYDERTFRDVPVRDTLGNQIGTETITSVSRHYFADGLLARSAGAHWSVGSRWSAQRSTFSNFDLSFKVGPAVEYDIFPYAESTRRKLTLLYGVDVTRAVYADTTIFDKKQETLLGQSLSASLNVTQPWGSTSVSLTGSHYFQDFSKNRLELFGSFNVRLLKGLSLNAFGSVSLVHDQLNLPKGGASESEILLQRRELLSSYRYFTFINLSYRFGSSINNVVNPRFGGGGGVFFFSN
jgi:uncharacterized protein DUF481